MGGGSRGAMHRRGLAGFAAVVLACLALGAVGLGVEDDLSPFSLKIPGTSASDGETLAQSHFGDSSPFAILLRGPAPALDRQGSALVAELRREPEATVLSPWDRGSLSALRPGPRKALVLVDYHVPLGTAMREVAPGLEATVEEGVDPPVVATQSGFATVAQALQEESLNATERAELVAAPLLILVLLLVFRSLVAAAIPLVFGALTVLAGRGVLSLLSDAMTIDALSLVVCTMMGLALGVDYSLLIVSRFREELERDPDAWRAAAATRASAGRTTLFAGLTLIVALLSSALLQPGSLLLSLAVATGVVTTISILIATLAVPPLLALLGPRINALRVGPAPRPGGRSAVAAAADSREPAFCAGGERSLGAGEAGARAAPRRRCRLAAARRSRRRRGRKRAFGRGLRTGGRRGRVDRLGAEAGRRSGGRSDRGDRPPAGRQRAPRQGPAPSLRRQPRPCPRPALAGAAAARRRASSLAQARPPARTSGGGRPIAATARQPSPRARSHGRRQPQRSAAPPRRRPRGQRRHQPARPGRGAARSGGGEAGRRDQRAQQRARPPRRRRRAALERPGRTAGRRRGAAERPLRRLAPRLSATDEAGGRRRPGLGGGDSPRPRSGTAPAPVTRPFRLRLLRPLRPRRRPGAAAGRSRRGDQS